MVNQHHINQKHPAPGVECHHKIERHPQYIILYDRADRAARAAGPLQTVARTGLTLTWLVPSARHGPHCGIGIHLASDPSSNTRVSGPVAHRIISTLQRIQHLTIRASRWRSKQYITSAISWKESTRPPAAGSSAGSSPYALFSLL